MDLGLDLGLSKNGARKKQNKSAQSRFSRVLGGCPIDKTSWMGRLLPLPAKIICWASKKVHVIECKIAHAYVL